MVETSYEHIVLNEAGTPVIAQPGTPLSAALKVVELVSEKIAYGWSPEELSFQHPYLSLGQIHSALAYYYDHREALDADLARRQERAGRIRIEQEATPGHAALRERLSRGGLR